MRRQIGLSLLEMMIALMIFAILSAITVGVLYNVFNTRERLDEESQRLSALQLSINLLQIDLTQIIGRRINSPEGKRKAFYGEPSRIEATRAGFANPLSIYARSTLQRIAYQCKEGKLLRIAWSDLDRTRTTKTMTRTLLDNIQSCRFMYYDEKNNPNEYWRLNEEIPDFLPRAIAVELQLNDWGIMNFLITRQL